MHRLTAATLALLLTACGARSTLSLGDDDAAPSGAGDAGLDGGRDSGRSVDAGADAGPRVDCRRDSDCSGGGRCRAFEGLTPTDLDPMPLTCGELDRAAPEESSCRQRSECARGLCTLSGTCVRPCVNDVDCAPTESCVETLVPTSRRSLQRLRACAPVVVAPRSVRVVGPEPAPTILGGAAPGPIDSLRLVAPNSLTVWMGEPDTQPYIETIRAADPPRALLYDESAFAPGAPPPDWAIAPVALGDLVTLMYPNGPNTPSSGSGLDVELLALGDTELSRFVAQRTDQGAGTLDLDLYFVGGQGWSSFDGELPPALRRGLQDLRNLLMPTGLRLGEVRTHTVVGETLERFEFLVGQEPPFSQPRDLDDLFRLSAGAARPSVNVFFVRSIEGALGIASGIPGPQIMHGTGASGIAIAADVLPVDEIGITLAHEIGHYMGMFHTSEFGGSSNDPFTDTEVCGPERDVNDDGFLEPFECEGSGAQYIMFWAASGGQISEQQSELMRRAYFIQ